MVKPLLIKEIRDAGKTIQKFETEVINPSIAPQRTINAVREALEGVVDEGTATVLKNPYYKVAAKTGTAQAESYGGGAGQQYLATMVGYFPADNPQYSCIVCIRTRVGGGNYNIYGSSLAGPVFKAIADRVYVTRYDWQEPVNKIDTLFIEPPAVKGGPAQIVRRAARELDIHTSDDTHRGDWATTTNDSVRVTLSPLAVENGVMPRVVGMGLQDALYLLESKRLKVDFTGKGKVVRQSPKAGERVKAGGIVTISLR
jgi:cell division protein FtsI (penicillin-binding protein 3)